MSCHEVSGQTHTQRIPQRVGLRDGDLWPVTGKSTQGHSPRAAVPRSLQKADEGLSQAWRFIPKFQELQQNIVWSSWPTSSVSSQSNEKCGNSGRKSLEDLQEAWIWRTKEPKLVMSMRDFHEFSNLVLFCWARLPDIRALHAAGVYCCSKALWEHHLSCSTIGQRSWKLKLRLSLVQINRNTKEKSCTWSSAFFPFCYLHEIQFCPSAIFFKDDQHSFLWCMQRISLPSQAKKGSTLYSE